MAIVARSVAFLIAGLEAITNHLKHSPGLLEKLYNVGKMLSFVFQLPIEIRAWPIMDISSKTVGDLVLEVAVPSSETKLELPHVVMFVPRLL